MDWEVDPCDDFFQFACSSKKRGRDYPNARATITKNLTDLIIGASGNFTFIKHFYESCVSILTHKTKSTSELLEIPRKISSNNSQKDDLDNLDDLDDLKEAILNLTKFSNWPAIIEHWNETEYSWIKQSEYILKHKYFLGAFQYQKFGQLEQMFSSVYFAPMIDMSVKKDFEVELREKYKSMLHIIPMTFPAFLKDDNSLKQIEYKNFMKIVMFRLKGSNIHNDTIISDIEQVFENEKKLARVSQDKYSYNYKNVKWKKFKKAPITDKRFEEIKLGDLDKEFLLENTTWTDFVNNIMDKKFVAKNSTRVLIPPKESMRKILEVINQMSKREQSNLLLWRVLVKFLANFVKTEKKDGLSESIFNEDQPRTNRSQNCVNQIKQFFPNIIDDLVINKYLEQDEKRNIEDIFISTRTELALMISNTETDWLSALKKRQREKMKTKLEKVKINVGEIFNEKVHRPEIKDIKPDDYFSNIFKIGESFWSEAVSNLNKSKYVFVSSRAYGETNDTAWYSNSLNQIQINVGLLKGSGIGYSKELPRALVYGGLAASTLGKCSEFDILKLC